MRYLIWCFNKTRTMKIEKVAFLEKEARKIYSRAVKSGCYSSVTLRVEKRNHGYAIESWSADGELKR